MTNEELIAKINAEIERLIRNLQPKNVGYIWKKETYRDILSFLSTLEEQAKYKVRNPIFDEEVREHIDLEEAAMNYIAPIENEDGLKVINFSGQDIKDAFIAGAKWQKEQDDRLADIIYQQGIEKGKDEIRKTLKKKEKK